MYGKHQSKTAKESLNRNILECKYPSRPHRIAFKPGLNRNILECKFKSLNLLRYVGYGLNRNILECKYMTQDIGFDVLVVLIETYWNVNDFPPLALAYGKVVLIETYWNVNQVLLHRRQKDPEGVLIETYWNVNILPLRGRLTRRGS